jgi:hypothetical protein
VKYIGKREKNIKKDTFKKNGWQTNRVKGRERMRGIKIEREIGEKGEGRLNWNFV